MGQTETNIHKAKALIEQLDRGLVKLGGDDKIDVELEKMAAKQSELDEEIRSKKSQINIMSGQSSAGEVVKLESSQKNTESDIQRMQKEIRGLDDKLRKAQTGAADGASSKDHEITALRAAISRNKGERLNAQSRKKTAEEGLDRLGDQIEAEEQVAARVADEQETREEMDADIKERVASEREAAEKLEKETIQSTKEGAADIAKAKTPEEKAAVKRKAERLAKRRERATKRLISLQDKAHEDDYSDIALKITKLQGKKQRSGLTDSEKTELEDLKNKQSKS